MRCFLPLVCVVFLGLAACGEDEPAPGPGPASAPTPDAEAAPKPAPAGEIKTEAVAYEHDGVQLEGRLVYDAARKGKRPGVLVVHEWWGLAEHPIERAQRLAALGYVAFCCDMYGKGKLTEDPKQAGAWAGAFYGDPHGAGRARARAGLAVLEQHPLADTSRLAAIGFCYGGSVALELAWSGAPLRAVVSFHGNPLPLPEQAAAGVKAALLICHGAADPLVGADALDALRASLAGTAITWSLLSYEGAVHAFTNPGADAKGIPGVAYQREADERSWADMLAFFAEHLDG